MSVSITPTVAPRGPQGQQRPPPSSGSLVFYSVGIYLSYLLYGYFQEYLMKEGRFGPSAQKFEYNSFLLFVQGLFNLAVAFCAIRAAGEPVLDHVPKWSYAISAGSQLAAMSFSFYALKFVDYPTQALAKACKPIPVMIMGILVFSKRYHWSKYFTVGIITGGIAVFMMEQETVAAKVGADPGFFGFGMLLLSLALDGVTGPVQDSLVAAHKPTANHLMFYSNLWSSLYSLIWVVGIGELVPALNFCSQDPSVWFYIIGQSLASAVGQIFIYRLIRSFGSLTLSIVTTSRKFFSILLSVAYFRHTLSTLQWTSIMAVFLGLAFDMIAPKARSARHHHHHHHHRHHHRHENNQQADVNSKSNSSSSNSSATQSSSNSERSE